MSPRKKSKKLIIYGIGKFTDYIKYAFQHDSSYEVMAQCLESNYLNKITPPEDSLPIVNFEDLNSSYPPDEYDLFIAVGNDSIRERLFESAKNKGYKLASYLSSKATYWDNMEIGENVFISEDSAMQPFVKIGNNTMIIGARIGHHCMIGSNVLLSLTFLGANVIIGDNSFLGLNSAVKPGIRIGDKNIIGMGCNILKDTKEGEVYTAAKTSKRGLTYFDLSDKYL